jgi:SNF2-related domain/Helicase conserved C-terminal domain
MENFTSISSDSFMRNKLDPVRNDLYEQVLYPKPGHQNKTQIQRSSYPELVAYLAKLSGKLNNLFSSLNTYHQLGGGVSSLRYIKDIKVEESQELDAAKSMTVSLNSGRSHIIRPSSQYRGGFDFIYSGLPESGLCLKPSSYQVYDSLATSKTNERTLSTEEQFSTIYKLLLGRDINVSDAHKRVVNRLPLNQSFSGLNSLTKEFDKDIFSDLKIPSTILGLLDYVKIFVVKEPVKRLVTSRLNADNRDSFDNSSIIEDKYNYLFNPNIYISLVLSLPKDWCEHISQVEGSEKVHLNSLNTWIQTWSSVAFSVRGSKADKENAVRESGGKLNFKHTPRYILSASHLTQLPKLREKLGFYQEQGRTNDEGLYVSQEGSFNWCPKAADADPQAAVDYENNLDAALELSFEAGSPLVMGMVGSTHPVFELSNSSYKDKIKKLKTDLGKYKGQMLTFNWDYNTVITSGKENPEKLVTISLAGATVPDDSALDDVLSKPGNKAFLDLAPDFYEDDKIVETVPGPIRSVCRFYSLLENRKTLPSFETLVKEAASQLSIKSLEDEKVAPYELGLYSLIGSDFKIAAESGPIGYLERTISEVLSDANGNGKSKLAKAAIKNDLDVDEDPHYYSHELPLSKFSNVYNYLGGKVFQLACEKISALKPKDLAVSGDDTLFPAEEIQTVVMPLAIMLGKYVPNSKTIAEKAEVLRLKLKPDDNLQIEDLKFAGLKKGVQLFPHQFDGHKILNNHPKFAFLDVAPGGGKTMSCLTDIMNLSGKGLIHKPIIFAPNRLVKNWCDDLAKLSDKWNVIPINLQQFRLWGEERLTNLIMKAPRNTLVVCGYRFLNGDKYSITVGSTAIQVSGTMEFLKKFKFDYIACDESHRTKNMRSFTHRGVKQLSTCSTVKYIRLATGSIIQNKLTDVVGQAAIMSSFMFKTAEQFENDNIEISKDPETGKKVTLWKLNAAENARKILAKNVGVITAKRRDWAFMLPTPDETFIPVAIDAEGDTNHSLMYQAVLKETLDEIKQSRPDIMKMISSSGAIDDEPDDDNEETKTQEVDISNIFSEDEDRSEELSAMLEPYIARLEQCLTDPLGDPFGKIFFEGTKNENFVSNKVKKIIERCATHFKVDEWSKGKTYNDWDYVSFKEKTYQLHREDLELEKQSYKSINSPDADKRWIERGKGKILIFCRYTRSVQAIYEALPANLKKITVKFTAKEKGGTANLAKFKNSDEVQILIANEQAISEGHNLQMAGRLIRCETPWSPGELDQSISRIFRPDPGGVGREMIYLDWLVANNSLEVPKMGRIIAKMLAKIQFDEYGNKNYDVLQKLSLPMIKMDLGTIASTQNLSDIRDDYIAAYQKMASIQGLEFRQRKQMGNTKMLDLTPCAMFEDSSILENVPYVPDQNIVDRNNLDLTKASVYLDENKLEKEADKLVGLKAHTEFGNGVVVKVAQSKGDATRSLRQIWVQLTQTGEIYKADPSVVYIAENLTEDDLKKLKKLSPWASPKNKKLAEKLELKAEKARLKEEKNAAKAYEKAVQLLAKSAAKKQSREEEETEDFNVAIFPVSYNGYLGLKASSDETNLENFGFKPFSSFAFLDITKLNPKQFDTLLDYLDDTFEVPNNLGKKLLALEEAFNSRTKKFDVDLAPVADYKNFYKISHTKAGKDEDTNKWILKIYPMIGKSSILLKVDIATNPFIKRHVGKKIPGLPVSWDSDAGMEIWMSKANTRQDLIAKIKDLKSEGFVIENQEDVDSSLQALKTRKARE